MTNTAQQEICEQTVDECACRVHRMLRYIRTLTKYVKEMLGVECDDECDGPVPRGRSDVPPVVQDCAVPCTARKRCGNQPCAATCQLAGEYFARKTLPKRHEGTVTPGCTSELVDRSLVKTDCMFFCCRGPEPATNRCVFRRPPPVPAPVPGPQPPSECCPEMACKTVAEQGKVRCPLRKGPCEYQDVVCSCGKPPAECTCAAACNVNRDRLIARCVDRLSEIVCRITALAEWQARSGCADADSGDHVGCPTAPEVAVKCCDKPEPVAVPCDPPATDTCDVGCAKTAGPQCKIDVRPKRPAATYSIRKKANLTRKC